MKPFSIAALATALLLCASAAMAQGASLVGEWSAQTNLGLIPIQVDLVIQPNGTYTETQRSPSAMTMQTGTVRAIGNSVVQFVVEDWAPKTHQVYHPTGTVGGYFTEEPLVKPPGGAWRVQFNGPNQVSMQDVQMGGVINFTRVR